MGHFAAQARTRYPNGCKRALDDRSSGTRSSALPTLIFPERVIPSGESSLHYFQSLERIMTISLKSPLPLERMVKESDGVWRLPEKHVPPPVLMEAMKYAWN